MPAPAVIPAPIVNVNVAAVKKLVVEFLVLAGGHGPLVCAYPRLAFFGESAWGTSVFRVGSSSFTVKKLECSKQAFRT